MTIDQQTAGLTTEQADMIINILEQVGFIGDRKSFSSLYDISPVRLNGFLRTSRARLASSKATDYSRIQYYNRLREAGNDPNGELAAEIDLTADEAMDNGLTIQNFRDPDSSLERDGFTNRKEDIKGSIKHIRSQGSDMSAEEIKEWSRKADGK